MRLNTIEKKAIKKAVNRFDPKASIYLFGSRTDDSKKGGDIDILLLSQKISLRNIINIKLFLYDALGEQKIDIVLAREVKKPFVKLAIKEGIAL